MARRKKVQESVVSKVMGLTIKVKSPSILTIEGEVQKIGKGILVKTKKPRSKKFLTKFYPDSMILGYGKDYVYILSNDELFIEADISNIKEENGYVIITDIDGDTICFKKNLVEIEGEVEEDGEETKKKRGGRRKKKEEEKEETKKKRGGRRKKKEEPEPEPEEELEEEEEWEEEEEPEDEEEPEEDEPEDEEEEEEDEDEEEDWEDEDDWE